MSSASLSKKNIARIAAAFLLATGGCGKDPSTGSVSEDFSSPTHFDVAASTGLWNSYDHSARAPIVAGANASYSVNFGDGSDGALVSSSGYTFNTDVKSVYNFTSVQLSGPVTVTGSQPLIIRSQGAVTITSNLSLDGTDASGATAGISHAGKGNGGAGGTNTGGNGGSGLMSSGSADAATPGNGSTTNGVNADPGSSAGTSPFGPGVDFDVAGFISGTGGGGGGGHSLGPAVGGAGGGGGGMLRISALGPVSLGTVTARGGNGADGGGTVAGKCAGAGAGGGGGAIWIQSFASISATSVDTSNGVGVTPACPTANQSGDGIPGAARGDVPSGGGPAWGTGNKTLGTDVAGTYTVQSTGYDLKTLNAKFTGQASLTSTLNGGTVAISYAGSADGVSYGSFVSDLTSLSSQGYRYIKFRLTITVVGTTSPKVTGITIPYGESGVAEVDGNLSSGT